MEKDPEMKGDGNSYTTEFRQYDPRLGRWLSLDPLMMQFPDMSPYVAFNNNPVVYTDPLGLESVNPDNSTDLEEFVVTAKKKTNSSSGNNNSNFLGKGQALSSVMKMTNFDHSSNTNNDSKNGFSSNSSFSNGQEIESSDLDTDPPKITGEEVEGQFSVDNNWVFEDGKWEPVLKGEIEEYVINSKVRVVEASAVGSLLKGVGWLLKGAWRGIKATYRWCTKAKAKFTVNSKKFDYFFGKVKTGNIHNIERSAQNLKDLTTLGIKTEKQLMKVFKAASSKGTVVKTLVNNFGTTVVKSINVAEKGLIEVSFFYEKSVMSSIPSVTTIIPKIFK